MYQTMPENDANMIFAMLFGGYNIEKDILEAYSITGIIHILSISGSHISLISLFLLSLYIETMDSIYSSQHPYHLNKPYVTLSAVHNNSFDQNPFYRYKAQHFLFSSYPYPYK